MNRKNRVVEEEKKIRINMVKKICILNSDEDVEAILKGIGCLLRNTKRSILLMDGNYEEVNLEIEKAIIAYMSTFPKKAEKSV